MLNVKRSEPSAKRAEKSLRSKTSPAQRLHARSALLVPKAHFTLSSLTRLMMETAKAKD